MAAQRQSPFANQPFDVAASNTESMIEEWLKQRRLPDGPEHNAPRMKPWYYGCIGGVPIPTLIRRLWQTTRDGVRTNRYGLPARFYTILWLTLWLASVGQFIAAVPEAAEMAEDYMHNYWPSGYGGPDCGKYNLNRYYRIWARGIINSLPLLVSMTIFFFPALVKP